MDPQPPCALRVGAARTHLRRWRSSPMRRASRRRAAIGAGPVALPTGPCITLYTPSEDPLKTRQVPAVRRNHVPPATMCHPRSLAAMAALLLLTVALAPGLHPRLRPLQPSAHKPPAHPGSGHPGPGRRNPGVATPSPGGCTRMDARRGVLIPPHVGGRPSSRRHGRVRRDLVRRVRRRHARVSAPATSAVYPFRSCG
jgi:hypothetical protein